MVVITPAPAALSPENLMLFYTTDELLSNSPIFVFYGPTATSTITTHSRIQVHIFSVAGFSHFARLSISPTAAYYSAVSNLPVEEQGDEISRGLAFSLYKCFAELDPNVKRTWEEHYTSMGRLPSAPALFSDAHAAMVATRMIKLNDPTGIIQDLRNAHGEQTLSWVDLDVQIPRDAFKKRDTSRDSNAFEEDEDAVEKETYGELCDIVRLFGTSAFLPTSKLRRAPSRPTSVNRNMTFSKKQKEALRVEMNQLLDTEESYVSRVQELTQNIAKDFRNKARHKSLISTSPGEQALKGLFPPSLDEILEVNTGFLEAITEILEDTENDAIEDIQKTETDAYVAPLRGQRNPTDVTGATAVAKVMIEWFPKFSDCYADYINAHAQFPRLLKGFTKDTASSFSKRVQNTGEQRLMSLLIEPVQRLPRYSLYIDNIVKQLPLRHPSLKTFLKARDIISEICSRDNLSFNNKVCNRLRKMVFSWPPTFNPRGRFITAIDYEELSPPYSWDTEDTAISSGLFLLFTDSLVLLSKQKGCKTTARSFIEQLESSNAIDTVGSTELLFYQQIKLSDVFLSEHSDNHVLQMISPVPSGTKLMRPRSRSRPYLGVRMFHLSGLYEGRVSRFVEEITTARIEGRFPETERESGKWEVRRVTGDLGLFCSISEEISGEVPEGRGSPARIQVVVDPSRFSKIYEVGDQGVELVAQISTCSPELLLLEISGLNGYSSRDKITSKEFLPVFTKRISNFFQVRNHIKNPGLCEALLAKNMHILKYLGECANTLEQGNGLQMGPSRPASPVKLLSSLFGGSVGKESGRRKLQRGGSPTPLKGAPKTPFPPAPSRGNSRDGDRSRPASGTDSSAIVSPADKLELAFRTLVMSLHHRKGNIVGRSVRARANADELAVNELYNLLLENPGNPEPAAQASVDVLFAAFEKFLKVAWTDTMGQVITQSILEACQFKSDTSNPVEFEYFFRETYNGMSPYNQRCLKAIVTLLEELLDGTSNDGDRGILTAAFAEILVPEGNPIDFISLIDRFVQDSERLFPQQQSRMATPTFDSVNSRTQSTQSTATGSLTSNTSLRKRFGLGTLTRENSKSEHESKVGYLWRTLSKSSHGPESQPSSLSKAGHAAFLARSNSTDAAMYGSPKRPSSRDRPTLLGAFAFESTSGSGLKTIGEVPSSTGPPRKKRRSSLSDLKSLQSANHTPSWSPQTPRNTNASSRANRQSSASPRTPSPLKPSAIPAPSRHGTPVRKENSPGNVLQRARTLELKSPQKAEEVTVKSFNPTKRRTDSISNIPTLKSAHAASNGLMERPTSGNTVKLPPSTPRTHSTKASTSSIPTVGETPKRLRLQSPQKLRERLNNQQRDIETAGKLFQAELSSIGQELAAAGRRPRAMTQTSAPPGAFPSRGGHGTHSNVDAAALLKEAEARMNKRLSEILAKVSELNAVVKDSLAVSEARAKGLDKAYREASEENEAIYARYNEELERLMRAQGKGEKGEVVGELERQVRGQKEVVERLGRENARLKREVVGLKAQLRE